MVSTHAAASRRFFVDAEYEKFREIGKQLSLKTKVAELAEEKSFYRISSVER